MSNVLNPNYNNYPEQTLINTKDIEYLKQTFKTSLSLNFSDTSVLISTTNISSIGKWIINRFIYSINGLLFKIKSFDTEKLYIEFYSDLSGQNEELTNFEFLATSESYDYDTQTSEIIGEVEYNASQHDNPIIIPAKITIPEVRYNPNLLINSNFVINQRGISSLTGISTGYMVDRWRKGVINADVSFTEKNCTIVINTGSLGMVLGQTIELPNMVGKKITASLNISSSNITAQYGTNISLTYYNDGTYLSSNSLNIDNKIGLVSFTDTIPANTTRIRFSIQTTSNSLANETITFDSPKLEIGEISTPFSPRSYAEELAMCQRYYQINRAFKLSNSSYTFYEPYLSFKTEMRTTPTIIGVYAVTNLGVVSSNDKTYYEISTNTEINAPLNSYGYQSKYGLVLSNGSGTFTADKQYQCQVVCDAEIY